MKYNTWFSSLNKSNNGYVILCNYCDIGGWSCFYKGSFRSMVKMFKLLNTGDDFDVRLYHRSSNSNMRRIYP